jgi:predicted transcriptional regulator
MAKNKKELMLEALFGGDMSPDLSSHHVQESGRDLQISIEMPLNKALNLEQTENKLSTQPGTELRTISEQTTNKLRTTESTVSKTENKLSTQPRTELRTISEQTTNKLRTNSSFSQLVGLQKKIIEIVYRFCRVNGEKTTDKISLEFLASNCKASTAVVQVTTRRLISKGVLTKFDSKEGRGGWTRYSLPEIVYKELFQYETENKLSTNTEQTENKLSTQPRTEPRTSVPYSSSNDFDKKNTITTGADTLIIPENLRRFGISTVNLQNLINLGKATQEVIERSLGALSFDVENGKTGNLANIFFGVLGTGREYISQKYSEALQIELDSELTRIKDTEEIEKKLQETKLQMKFKEYLEQNPEFIESVKNRHKTFVNSPSVLEKVAFEEFKGLLQT